MTVFHRLNVAAIERETPDAVAITLRVPEELQNQYRYTPGQHLTLKALVNGEELRRCYSICSSPQEGLLQIGVKAIDQGRFSGFVNRMLKVGDALEVMVPQGRFGYQPQAERHGNYRRSPPAPASRRCCRSSRRRCCSNRAAASP